MCLDFRICGHISAGYRVVAPLASGVCHLVGEVDLGAVAGFLMGEASACPLMVRAESHPSVVQGYVKR